MKIFDTKCYELAKLFLSDIEADSRDNCDALAFEIQTVIDDFIEALPEGDSA